MRAKYIDIAKGFAILCIVLLHFENGVFPSYVNVFIGSFMISTFYVVSGWIDFQRPTCLTYKERLRKRWQQLGKPYLWWSALILLFDCVLWIAGYYDTYFMGREIYKTITLRGIGTLWFLPALFGGEIIWLFIRKKRSMMLFLLMLLATYVYQSVYDRLSGGHTDSLSRIIDAPFRTVSNMLSAWIGIAAGYGFHWFFAKHSHLIKNCFRQFYMGAALCVIAYFAANYCPIAMLWDVLAPLLGPLGILFICMSVQTSRWINYFDYWGGHSLALMVTHYSFLLVVCEMVNKSILHHDIFSGVPTLFFFAITMILEYCIVEWVHRKAPCLIGKQYRE
jgi:hypothetical protein